MAEATAPRRRGVLRGVLIGLLVLVVLVVAAGAVGWARFDPNVLKPRIAAAVKRATGRDLVLDGPLGLALNLATGLVPTVTAERVALANIAGGSRPAMATVQRLRISVALWPLLSHRVVIEGLTLEQPDILLERNAQGTPNWVLRPDVPAQSLPGATPSASRVPTRVELAALRIEGGHAAWRDARGHLSVVDIASLDLTAPDAAGPAHIAGQLVAHGVPVSVDAQTGPLTDIAEGHAPQPWPLKLTLAALGAHAGFDGALAEPAQGRGYAGTVTAAVPDLAAFDRIFPHAHLPDAHDIKVSAHVADLGLPVPQVQALTLHLGAADLTRFVPALRVTALDLTDTAADQPSHVDAHGSFRAVPLTVSGTFGPPRTLLPGAPDRFAVDLIAQAAGAQLAVKGSISEPLAMQGINLGLTAKAADLSTLAPLVGHALPALRDVDFTGHFGERSAGFALSDFTLKSAQGDLLGGIDVDEQSGRPHILANLTSGHLDFDALQAALPAAPPQPPPLQPAPPVTAPPAPPGPARLIPDTRLPLDTLRAGDAAVRLTVATLRTGGKDYRNVVATVQLTNGHLTLAPVSADTPGGSAQGAVEIDAGQVPPSVGVALHASDLALAPLLAALHQAADVTGDVMVDADLHGTGDTLRALAATLDGHLGLTMVNGEVDNALLTRLFGKVLNSAHLPAELAGHTDVRCFAVRFDARHGLAELAAFAIDTSRLSMTGTGSINLADEALALQLRPLLRLGGSGVAVPVRVGGTLAAPQAGLDALEGGRVGAVFGAIGAGGQADRCGPALALARGGQPGPTPAPPPAAKGVNAGDLLRLFRRH